MFGKITKTSTCSKKSLNEPSQKLKESSRSIKLKYYLSHFNGGRPFLVVVENNNKFVKIYKQSKNGESYDKLIGEYKPKKIYIGKDSTDRSFDGNTVLLQLTEDDFIYVGAKVYKFSLEKGDKFTKYFSMVGNNDTPYPVLLCKNNVYFLAEQKFITKDKFIDKNVGNYENAYDYYYGQKGTENMGKLYGKKISLY